MSENRVPGGNIAIEELAQLADLFDRYEFAFDPLSREAKEAESEFEERVRFLYTERIEPHFTRVSFIEFHCRIKSRCREYIRKNAP